MPSSKTAKGLAEQIEKVGFLKELGADRLVVPDLPLAGLEHFARRHPDVRSRPPQINPASPSALGGRRSRVELKKLTLSRHQ
jgi:hypothetical protein